MKIRIVKHRNMVFPVPTLWAREYNQIIILSLSFITASIQIIGTDDRKIKK